MASPQLSRFRVSPDEIADRISTAEGKQSATAFQHGSLVVKLYAPRGLDTQQPHSRDEAYVVISGKGTYRHGEERVLFRAGDFLFAKAGVYHCFESFTDDFVTWVLFYGPEGGE